MDGGLMNAGTAGGMDAWMHHWVGNFSQAAETNIQVIAAILET
jgi:hypothetical protein